MTVKLRVLLFLLISSAVAAAVVLLYMYKSPAPLNSIETFCGYRGPLFKSIQANLSRDQQLLLNRTRRAFRDEYPFSALLTLTVNETSTVGNESHWERSSVTCNGVIVSQHWLLTSARCVNHSLLLNESYATTAFLSSDNLTQEVTLPTLQVVSHFNFTVNETTGRIDNDIALVRVEAIKFIDMQKKGHYSCPLCTDAAEETEQLFTPWFLLDDHNFTLYTSEMKIVNAEKCATSSPSFSPSTICTNQTTLTLDGTKKVDEKGSPLVTQAQEKMNLIGISSYYIDRKDDLPLLVYTNVTHYREWITRAIY